MHAVQQLYWWNLPLIHEHARSSNRNWLHRLKALSPLTCSMSSPPSLHLRSSGCLSFGPVAFAVRGVGPLTRLWARMA
jgi:hypothetical protein